MITQEMLISEILAAHPEAAVVFERHGLPCGACVAARMESLSAVAVVHDVDLECIMSELNAVTRCEGFSEEGE